MPTPDEGIQSQLRKIESTYSRSIDELVAEVVGSGLTKHTEVVGLPRNDRQQHYAARGAAPGRQASYSAGVRYASVECRRCRL